jgi:hypothetical protein
VQFIRGKVDLTKIALLALALFLSSAFLKAQMSSRETMAMIDQFLRSCPYIDKKTGVRCQGRVDSELISEPTANPIFWKNTCSNGHSWVTKNDEQTPFK